MKIYTYANPFDLADEPFWDEIRFAPHFCVSQTLVQGLTRHYGRHAFNYICTADRIINMLYAEWYQNVELKIEQYVSISRQIELVSDSVLAKALKFNQQSLVDAFRFAVTLGIDANGFDKRKLPKEQAIFLDMLCRIKNEPCWKFDNTPTNYQKRLTEAITNIFTTEMEDSLSIIIKENNLKVDNDAKLFDRINACLEYLEPKKDEQSQRQYKILQHYTALSILPDRKSVV